MKSNLIICSVCVMTSYKFEVELNIPDGFDIVKMTNLWNTSSMDEKLDLLTFLHRTKSSGVVVPVPGYIFVSRSDVSIHPSRDSDAKPFGLRALRDDGLILSGNNSIIGLFNYDKELGMAIAKSFPSGTFRWDVCHFANERKNKDGYVVW